MSSVLEVLSKAKNYIERFGWIKGEYGDPWQGFCLTGACRAAVDVTGEQGDNLPPILRDVYAAFTTPLIRRGKDPWRYSEMTPRGPLTNQQLEYYREPLADSAELIDYNDYADVNKEDVLNLIDEAIECAKQDTRVNGTK